MVPRVTSKGKSFKGAGAYFLHDLGKAQTSERVAFTHTVNMLTDDPEKALKVMAWTAEHAQDLKAVSGQKMTGRKAENPVYNYVLAWAPDQNPDQAHMVEFGLRSLETLGVAEHEALFIAHDDTDHKHLHVMVNRVHPVTGIMAKMDHDQNRLSRLAQGYEEETGRIYCPERVANNARRDHREPNVKAEPAPRLIETPEYDARRQARAQAQRAAGAREAARLAEERNMQEAARDFRAAFDTSAGRDDRQYRNRETERPRAEEQAAAGAAWEDEKAKEKERAKGDRDKARLALREKRRRAWLDERRAEDWANYEARQLQALNDKQTERREGLRDIQAESLRRIDDRLARKYTLHEKTVQRRIEDAQAALHSHGARAVLDKVTGARKAKEARLKTLQAAANNLARQKLAERAAYEAKQRDQRAAQAKRQEEERQTLTKRLAATRARQDAKFEDQERARLAKQGTKVRAPANQDRPSHAFAQSAAFREFSDKPREAPTENQARDKGQDREPER